MFWGSDFLDEEISMLWSILDTEYKISGMDTDESAELYFKFGNNEISKSKIMSDLKNYQNKMQSIQDLIKTK